MFTRPVVIVVTLLLAAPVAAAIARPAWATELGLDVWNLPALREQTETAANLARELEGEDDEIRRRIEVKEDLIQSLIAGRSTLAETTAQFMILNQDYPEYMNVIRHIQPGSTDLEKMARNVIDYSLPRLNSEPLIIKIAVLSRLNAELRSLSGDVAEAETN